MVRKRNERSGELKTRKRIEYVNNRKAAYNGIGVNTVGMTYYCQLKVNAVRHKLTTVGFKLMLLYELTVNPTIYTSCIEQFWATVKAKTVTGEVQLQALVDGKKVIITESTTSGPITNIADEAVNEEMNDSLERAATTASSLESEQDSGNINKTQSKATPNESSSQRTDSGSGPRCQETMGDTIAQTRSENVSKFSNDSLLAGVNTPQSDEDRLKLKELMELYLSEDSSKQGRISNIDADEDIALVSTHDDAEMFYADKDLHGEEVFVAKQDENVVEKEVEAAQVQVSTAATTAIILIYEVTLAQALSELKNTKPKAKAKGIVFHEPEESTTTTTATIPKLKSQDKGKAIMIEEPMKLKKKDQIMLDEEVALKLQAELQAEFEKEQSLASENAQQKQEVNSALIKEWNDIQAKINVDYLLVQRLQAEEQRELTDAEKATLFMQFLDKRRKFFAAKVAEEKRNKPPTQAQQRKIMCTYL
nr:hypothetical protein [Tanacetum cinerariifolium]